MQRNRKRKATENEAKKASCNTAIQYLVTEKSSIGGENPRRAKKYFVYVYIEYILLKISAVLASWYL